MSLAAVSSDGEVDLYVSLQVRNCFNLTLGDKSDGRKLGGEKEAVSNNFCSFDQVFHPFPFFVYVLSSQIHSRIDDSASGIEF